MENIYLHASDTTRHSNKLNTDMYPGLFFCSKEVDIPLQHERLISVLIGPAFINMCTNCDRIEHFDITEGIVLCSNLALNFHIIEISKGLYIPGHAITFRFNGQPLF